MKVRGGRALLNRAGHESTAAIVAEIEDTRGWPEGKDGNGDPLTSYRAEPEYTFQIADCARVISLDLRYDSAPARRNNLYKVDTMIKALTKFREGLADEQERYVERSKKVGE